MLLINKINKCTFIAIGNTSISIVNKLNIITYSSACIELLRSLFFTLYIYSLCASRRGAGSWTTTLGGTVAVGF